MNRGQRDRETGGRRDGETGRTRDGETERIFPSVPLSLRPSVSLSLHPSFSPSPYLLCFGALTAALLLSTAIGAVSMPLSDVARMLLARLFPITPDWPATFNTILFDIRLPRTALIALTGASLAGSGSAYQGLFRNPLADPYLIGIASGASLGAVIAMAWRWPASALSFLAVPVAAFVGALLAAIVVYNIARVGKTTPITTLILAGVAFGSFATALTTLLMLNTQGELRRAVVWMLGGFSLGGWSPVIAVLPFTVIGSIVLIALGRALNVLQFGDDQARQLGLNVERVRLIVIAAASLTTAAAVAFSGVIGFVGLAVPHLIRLMWGGDYRRLIPLSILGGAAGLLLADILARTLLAPQEVPVGVITALIGAPFFVWLLRRAKQQMFW
jgi:iron complex transport system permease protein